MLLTVISKTGEPMLVNPDNIIHISSALGGGSLINFIGGVYIVVQDSYESLLKKINPKPKELTPGPLVKELLADVSSTLDRTKTSATSNDAYPDFLPRLPTGNVDKRTVQYKEYIASTENNK
jgi:uncharacterized protein YlzI (FlbEa/FlbD family)